MSKSPDMTGTTAAIVHAALKAQTGNPSLVEAFDPSVIGSTLEVLVIVNTI